MSPVMKSAMFSIRFHSVSMFVITLRIVVIVSFSFHSVSISKVLTIFEKLAMLQA